MRKVHLLFLLLVFALLYTGCDSNGSDGPSDAEIIRNSWTLSTIEDGSGDRTATFNQAFDAFRVTFKTDGTYELVVDSKDNNLDRTLTGTYVLATPAKTLSIAVSVGGPSVNLVLGYSLGGETRLTLSGDSILLNLLISNANLTGTVKLNFTR